MSSTNANHVLKQSNLCPKPWLHPSRAADLGETDLQTALAPRAWRRYNAHLQGTFPVFITLILGLRNDGI